jgi:hypothetical protein
MRRYWYLVVAAAIASALAVVPTGSAFAAGNVLTVGSTGGAAVGVGDVLNASLVPGTTANFFSSATGTTGIKCTGSSFSATVGTNPIAPGTAAESLTSQTVTASTCTINVAFTRGVRSITFQNLPYSATVNSNGTVTVTGNPLQTTVVIIPTFGSDITCVYQASSITGTASNVNKSIKFTAQPVNKVSGPGTCFSTGFFSAEYGPIGDTTQGGQLVFLN